MRIKVSFLKRAVGLRTNYLRGWGGMNIECRICCGIGLLCMSYCSTCMYI